MIEFRPYFEATIHFLPTICGGRKGEVISGYRPTMGLVESQFLDGVSIEFVNVETVYPNDTVEAKLTPFLSKTLIYRLKIGQSFVLTEGEKIIAAGIIDSITLIENII